MISRGPIKGWDNNPLLFQYKETIAHKQIIIRLHLKNKWNVNNASSDRCITEVLQKRETFIHKVLYVYMYLNNHSISLFMVPAVYQNIRKKRCNYINVCFFYLERKSKMVKTSLFFSHLDVKPFYMVVCTVSVPQSHILNILALGRKFIIICQGDFPPKQTEEQVISHTGISPQSDMEDLMIL